MTCRNVSDDIKTESWVPLSRAVWETSAYCPDGVRHKGGASLAWALMWNVRTCDSERRWLASGYPPSYRGGRLRATRPTMMGDPQVVAQREVEYRMQSTGADRLVVAGKLGNASGAKGAGCPGQPNWANHLEWEELVRSVRSRARLHGCHEPGTSRGVRPVL